MKLLLKLGFVVISLVTLSGCTADSEVKGEANSESVEQKKVTISITIKLNEDGKEFTSKQIEVTAKENLLTSMQKEFEVEEKNGMITAIDGHKQNEKESKYWLYDVNGKQASLGASEYYPKNGDVIEWSLNELNF